MTNCDVSLLFLMLLVLPARAEDVSPASATGTESLGDRLLEDLPVGMKSNPAPRRQNPPNPESTSTAATAAVVPRFDDLGEDVGQPSGPLPLVRAKQEMQRASTLLGESTLATSVQHVQLARETQSEVVARLDELIAALSKKCQGGQCAPSDQPPAPKPGTQAKPAPSSKSAGGGKTPARDSNDPLNRDSAKSSDSVARDELAKRLWGHLPTRSRDQMLQSFSDEFLPKYELEIEQYYRRLSEMPAVERAD